MSDRYTELAREWLAEHVVYRVDGKYPSLGGPETEAEESIAALLRRVAREQIEEDARLAADRYSELETDSQIALERKRADQNSASVNRALEAAYISATLRSRAKELED